MKKYNLSNRQMEIMDMMWDDEIGASEIAIKLCIEISTVYLHLSQIRALYDTNSTTIALIRYMKERQK